MENLNEQDMTKKMLNVIRKPITEAFNQNQGNDEEDLTSSELSEEQKAFRDTVTPRVEFTGFKVYPKNKNVVFSGKFENMGGLEWQFTLEDADGLYITAKNMPVTNDSLTTLKKLKGYYDNWADEWAQKLATEYNRDSSDSDNEEDEVQQTDTF